jgi:uncharacterized phage-associated protein
VAEIRFDFQREKAIESILYIAKRAADPTFHSINKLLYFADKTSLERYGRFICGDDYYAMRWGPVPTNTYDLMKNATQGGAFPFRVEGNTIIPSRDAEIDLLSESDIECLDASLRLYGDAPFWKRQEVSHDEAYKEAWDRRGESGSVRMPIENIVRLLEDADELIDYLAQEIDPERIKGI